MIEKLKIKVIYDDFLSKVSLTEEQKNILNMMIKKEKVIKIAIDLGMSERKVKYETKRIRELYNKYWELEMVRLLTMIN